MEIEARERNTRQFVARIKGANGFAIVRVDVDLDMADDTISAEAIAEAVRRIAVAIAAEGEAS